MSKDIEDQDTYADKACSMCSERREFKWQSRRITRIFLHGRNGTIPNTKHLARPVKSINKHVTARGDYLYTVQEGKGGGRVLFEEAGLAGGLERSS